MKRKRGRERVPLAKNRYPKLFVRIAACFPTTNSMTQCTDYTVFWHWMSLSSSHVYDNNTPLSLLWRFNVQWREKLLPRQRAFESVGKNRSRRIGDRWWRWNLCASFGFRSIKRTASWTGTENRWSPYGKGKRGKFGVKMNTASRIGMEGNDRK